MVSVAVPFASPSMTKSVAASTLPSNVRVLLPAPPFAASIKMSKLAPMTGVAF